MMKAMVLEKTYQFSDNSEPLRLTDVPKPEISGREILLKVRACGVCHTELDEIEGRTPPPVYPMILGHQVIGDVVETGPGARRHAPGTRVGVGWIYASCGRCSCCLRGDDNLCAEFMATGRDAPGGYAEFMKVPEDSAMPIPDVYTDSEAAPLLCAGAIGYRSLRLTNMKDGDRLGLTGFGASGHLVLKMVAHQFPNTDVYVFARSGKEQAFARELGAVWAGNTVDRSPDKLDCIIDTTPVWKPVVEALDNLKPGGRLVINAIRKEDADKDELLRIDYPRDLWMEKEIKSVANVAKRDISDFLKLAAEIPIKPEYEEFELKYANLALNELKNRKIRGAKVLVIN